MLTFAGVEANCSAIDASSISLPCKQRRSTQDNATVSYIIDVDKTDVSATANALASSQFWQIVATWLLPNPPSYSNAAITATLYNPGDSHDCVLGTSYTLSQCQEDCGSKTENGCCYSKTWSIQTQATGGGTCYNEEYYECDCSSSNALSSGDIAGIVVGSVIGGLLIIIVSIALIVGRRKRQPKDYSAPATTETRTNV
jgi:hypothetical protein